MFAGPVHEHDGPARVLELVSAHVVDLVVDHNPDVRIGVVLVDFFPGVGDLLRHLLINYSCVRVSYTLTVSNLNA